MCKKSIIMIGPFPPPVGGVSIHLSRLVNKLENKYSIYKIDTTKNRLKHGILLLKLLGNSKRKSSQYIVHNHVFDIRLNVIITFLCKLVGIKYIQTVHSFRPNKAELSKREVSMIKFIFRNSYKVIVVSNKIKDDLLQFDKSLSKKFTVLPAFIPYEKRPEVVNKKSLEELKIDNFIISHKIILCANASRIVTFKNQDLYGIDLTIELMKKIKELTKYSVGFIFMLPHVTNNDYYNKLINRIHEYGIEKDFVFVTEGVEMVPLLEYVDIFLRPTNTDGDALSIREALYSGTPCIASDVVERPLGTVTFKTRDASDLYNKVLDAIKNIDEEKIKARYFGNLQSEYIESYYQLYDVD
ncbi:glycosyltransferase family 4 protein [Neobacillus sp. FSL H8-0543]|uniref:glycosyltransferase family 4 protein n=1 Tax=Neobacillus sp. FSL H8-0543 TaxID=2954672 RepID=UPI0031590442